MRSFNPKLEKYEASIHYCIIRRYFASQGLRPGTHETHVNARHVRGHMPLPDLERLRIASYPSHQSLSQRPTELQISDKISAQYFVSMSNKNSIEIDFAQNSDKSNSAACKSFAKDAPRVRIYSMPCSGLSEKNWTQSASIRDRAKGIRVSNETAKVVIYVQHKPHDLHPAMRAST